MADIFLSYAREDLARAEPLVRAMEAENWKVFWDPSIVPGAEYRQVIDREIDDARSVVVLWSRHSIASPWVRDEADTAAARGVLVPVSIDDVKPPTGLRQAQSANLVGWNGEPDAPALMALLRAIAQRIGGRADIKLRPLRMHLITGDRTKYPELGPTVNMLCELTNGAEASLQLRRLDLVAVQRGEPVYHLVWHLFYDDVGDHLKTPTTEPIIVPGNSMWSKGVQFRETRADVSNAWRAGQYEFELLGWANRRPMESVANVRTTFHSEVSDSTESQLREWRAKSRQQWAAFSNRAYGFGMTLKDVKTGV